VQYLHTWCGLSANLRCRSEACCTRLAENTGRKKVAKNRQLCRATSSQLSSNMSSCPHNMANFGQLAAEIDPVVWGTPANFNWFRSWQRYCTASSSERQPNFAALNRGRHLCSAGRPSRWALAHISYGRPT